MQTFVSLYTTTQSWWYCLYSDMCCCQVVWQIRTLGIKIFLFHISINLFRSWHTIVKNKLMHISLFFINVCQLRNKFMFMWNKNVFIWFVHFCQTTWQQHMIEFTVLWSGHSINNKHIWHTSILIFSFPWKNTTVKIKVILKWLITFGCFSSST